MIPSFDGASIKELPVDLALGHRTAMDVLSNNDENATMEMWCRLLNCGFRVAIPAGTDAFRRLLKNGGNRKSAIGVRAATATLGPKWSR